jgi:glycerol-3-phosphate dehydrogenase
MRRNPQELVRKEYDLVVIGGGIFGVCAAWDAAHRGLSVALVEKNDFSHATSAHHFKMVHGGIRYLQHADIYRVRESCRERSALLRIAPHLVKPLPVVIPTYGWGKKGKGVLGAGLLLYDFLTLDRNRAITDPVRQIPKGRFLTRREVLDIFPGLETEGLTGGALFCDGQMYNPPRLALSFLRAAADAGAEAANYLEVTHFLRKGRRVAGVGVRDNLTGEAFEIRGKVVLNAAGPWAAPIVEKCLGVGLSPVPVFSRDACFVVRRSLSETYALACQTRSRDADAVMSRGGRHLFLVPWRGFTLVGVWHVVHQGEPEAFTVSEKELQSFLDETNETYPAISLSLDDVTVVDAGLILFEENEQGSNGIHFGKRSILWDHEKIHGVEGLVTLIGVRATTARGVARKAVDLVFRKLGKRAPKSRTETTPIHGGRIESFEDFLAGAIRHRPPGMDGEVMRCLVHNHGSGYGEILDNIGENAEWAERVGTSPVIKAEVVHAVREEMARKLGDVVFRRTDLGTGDYPGEDALRTCADLIAAELGWNEARVQQEVDDVTATFIRYPKEKPFDKGGIPRRDGQSRGGY